MAQLDAKQLEARKVKRMRYFDGLFLRQEEFNLEQNYHIRMRRLHNYFLHSYGIIRGLEVKADNVGEEGATVATLRISPGMALIEMTSDIDYNNPEDVSQEILITDETIVNISYSNDFKEKEYRYIYLTHTLEKVDIYDDRGGKEQIHWWEKAEINCKTEYPKSRSMVVLAKVELTSDIGRKKITNVSVSYEDAGESLRTYAGSYGKITLPVENAKQDVPLPTIQGKNFGSAGDPKNGIQITAEVTDVEGNLRVNGNTDFTGDWTIVGNTDITGDLTVNGNITVLEGGMAQIHTVDAEVRDAIFRINKYNFTNEVPQVKNTAGIEIFRGYERTGTEIAETAQLVWNENDDKWYLGVNREDGLVNITQLTDQSVVDIHRHNQLYTQNGSLALSVNSSGNIGIGAPPPAAQEAKLEVGGKISATELNITSDANFQGILSASTLAVTGAFIPSLGNSETNGIMFPKNPGGGKDDGAWVRYYPRAQEGYTLEIGISNDPGDHILLHSPGGVGIGINNLDGFKLNICGDGAGGHVLRVGGNIKLLGYDRLDLISFGVDGDYQILHKAEGSVFHRNTLTLHVDEKDAFGVYSTNWNPLLEVCGGTGDFYIRGNAGIGTASPRQKLEVAGNIMADGNFITNGAFIPSLGNSETNGIMFPKNPGGGKDGAWVRYYRRVQEGCTLEIGISNDPGDHILLHSPGGVGIGINNLDGFKLNICGDGAGGHVLRVGGDIKLHGYDRLNLISFGVDGDYQILHKAQGAFQRSALAVNVGPGDAFGVYSSGSVSLLEVCGGTGDLYIRGKVGIGINSPQEKLHVAGNVKVDGRIITGPGAGNGLLIPVDPALPYGAGARIHYYEGDGFHSLEIDASGGSNNPNAHISLMPTNNVGIGLVNPLAQLTVNANLSFKELDEFGGKLPFPAIMIGSPKGSTMIIQGKCESRNAVWFGWIDEDFPDGGDPYYQPVPRGGLGTLDGQPLILQSDEDPHRGFVGIGKSMPQAKLDVGGTFRVNEGTVFNRIQAGTFLAERSEKQMMTYNFPFPTKFESIPKVVMTPRNTTDPEAIFVVNCLEVYPDQVTVKVYRVDKAGWSSLSLDWYAWEESVPYGYYGNRAGVGDHLI